MNTFRNLTAALQTTIVMRCPSLCNGRDTTCRDRSCMHITRTALLILGSSLLLWGNTADSVSSLAPEASAAPAELTAAEVELIDWARARFALVDLDLPPVEVEFHADAAPCGGFHGTLNSDGGRFRVRVCIPDRGTSGSKLQRERTLIHEFAHAWERANIDDGEREALLEVVDADVWYTPESAWEERGEERFAETIVWGLYDQRRRPIMIDTPCRELHADFRSITGHAALGSIHPVCSVGVVNPSGLAFNS